MFFLVTWITITSASPPREGMPVILQSDIRTVIVKMSIQNVTHKILELDRAVGEMMGRTDSLDMNRLGSRKDVELLSRSIRPLDKLVDNLQTRMNEIFEKGRMNREKRAIEFLGSALNWISGVPTAEDHRKVLEQVNRIRLDEVTAVDELKKQNTITQQALKHLTVHETEIADLQQKLSKLKISHFEGVGISLRTIAVLLVSNQVQQLADSVRQDIQQIERILDKSDIQLLDRSAISVSTLSKIIDGIFLQSRNSTPVFQQGDCHYYYKLPLTHSWVSDNNKWLMTLLQVPITPVGQSYTLTVLDPLNRIFPDLSMAVTSMQSNQYRYLSLSDIDNCHHLTSHLLCIKRKIEIVPAHGCSIQLGNCRVWATNVVHDITNTEFMLILSNPMKATMSCDNATDRYIDLPSRLIMRLSLTCTLHTESFIIHKLSYRHLADETTDAFRDEKIQLIEDDEILRRRLNVHSDIPSSELPKLKTLMDNNKNLMDEIRQNERKSRTIWENISGGQTPLEQIIVWSLLSLSLLLSTLSVFLQMRSLCRNWKQKLSIKSGAREIKTVAAEKLELGGLEGNTMEILQDVNQRLRNLETMQLRRQPRTGRMALTDDRRQEELDV
jgi:hypothetical protein